MSSDDVRTVVVTGGTGGIGFRSALGIAKTGAHVVITDGGKSAKKAARSTIWGATSADDGMTGRYFDTDSKEQNLHPTAYDTQVQERILATIEASGGPSSARS